jgi:hypothetical protein
MSLTVPDDWEKDDQGIGLVNVPLLVKIENIPEIVV